MTSIDIDPDSPNDSDNNFPIEPDDNENNRKFPDDDSNVGDNPRYPSKDDQVPKVDIIPSEIVNDDVPSQPKENNVDQEVGSDKGGVYPYNINSNTADDNEHDPNTY